MNLKELYVPKYEIFVDMDGVIADFDKQFKEFSGQNSKEYEQENGTKAFWKLIDKIGVKYWSEMSWMPEGKELWNYVAPYNPKLLSAPSRSNNSRLGKKEWVEKHLPGVQLILAERPNKQNYSGRDKILIDDNKQTITEWKANSGIGLHFISTTQTIEELKKLGL